jgi:hypothetical protein
VHEAKHCHFGSEDEKLEKSDNRYLIVGTGRSGSSLLSSILADAGCNFAMENVKSWNPRDGEYEHPLLLAAETWRSRIERIRNSVIPGRLSAFCHAQMERRLTQLFEQAEFAKSIPLIGLVDVVHRLGFQPVMIVNYRGFQDYARSVWMSRPFWDMPHLIDRYVATYSTAILQLEIFGGCTISYDELIDPEKTQWAKVLGEITPASEETILKCRNERVRADIAGKERALPILEKSRLDPRLDLLYDTLRSLEGRALSSESHR